MSLPFSGRGDDYLTPRRRRLVVSANGIVLGDDGELGRERKDRTEAERQENIERYAAALESGRRLFEAGEYRPRRKRTEQSTGALPQGEGRGSTPTRGQDAPAPAAPGPAPTPDPTCPAAAPAPAASPAVEVAVGDGLGGEDGKRECQGCGRRKHTYRGYCIACLHANGKAA